MQQSIHELEQKMRQSKGLENIFRRIGLFFSYMFFGLYQALHVLFSSSHRSFETGTGRDEYGVWKQSFSSHVGYKRSIRLFSVTTPVVVVSAAIVMFGAMQLLFPTGIANVYAATNIFAVTNNNDSGAGSLRQAITDANSALASDTNIIRLDYSTADSPLVLLSDLPTINKPVTFENPNGSVIFIVDGINIGATGACLVFGSGAANSELAGIALQNCEDSGVGFTGAPTGIKIGSSTGDAEDHVYISNSGYGIKIRAAVGATTIQNVTIGLNHNQVAGANTDDGILIEGDGHTITNVTVGNSRDGIAITGTNNSITSSYIGVTAGGNDIGNTRDGVNVATSGSNTIGGDSDAAANVIGFNGDNGIHIRSSANNTSVRANSIGTNSSGAADYGNGSSGLYVQDSSSAQLGNVSGAYTLRSANNGGAGIRLDDSDSARINYAQLHSNTTYGLYINSSDSAIAQSGAYYSNTLDGVYIDNSASAQITGNTIGTNGVGADLGNSGDGVDVRSGSDVRIGIEVDGGTAEDANIISHNGEYAVRIDSGSSAVYASQNTYESNTAGIIDQSLLVNAPTITEAVVDDVVSGTGGDQDGYVQLYIDGAYVEQVDVTDAAGAWTTTDIDGELEEGDSLTAILIDSDSNVSAFSTAYTVTAPVVEEDPEDPEEDPEEPEEPEEEPQDPEENPEEPADPEPTPAVTIESMSVDSGVTVATLTVETSRVSTVAVAYGRSETDLNSSATSTTSATEHTIQLSDLDGGKNYIARVTVTDSEDNTATTDTEFTTESINTAYLLNAYVDGQKVYDTGNVFYVDPSATQVTVDDANNNHQVRLSLVDEENNESVATNEWKQVENRTVTQTIKNLDSGTEYTLEGQGRVGTDETTESAVTEIATVIASAAAPQITSLSGEYTVTTKPQSLQFAGSAQTGQFRFQNIETGAIVATCPLDASGVCELPFALSQGAYNVLHESLSGGIPSAPDLHTLVVTYPRTTTVLNTDSDSTSYLNRIVTSADVTVAGLGPAEGTGILSVNGSVVGEVTYTESVVWQSSINLDTAGVNRGDDFIIEVVFTDANGKRVHSNDVYYPAHFAFAPVKPIIGDLAAEYTRGSQFTAVVNGGAGDTVRVFVNGELFHTTALPDTGVIAAVEVPVATTILGTITYEVEVENSIGLKTSTTAEYIVNAGVANVSAPQESTDTAGTDSSEDAEASEDEPETTTTDEELVEDATDGEEVEQVIQAVVPGEDISVIPAEYRVIVTDPVAVAEIKEVLEEQNVETLKIEAVREVLNEQTGEVTIEPIETNEAGQQILRATTQRGLPALPFLGGQQEEQDQITFGGETEPYALVTLEIHSDPIVQVARADEDGKWTMVVNVDDLPEGSHTAYLQTESRGVQSDQIEIAKFVVVEERSLSNTTWIFIINISVVLLGLGAWLVSQMQRKNAVVATEAGTVIIPTTPVEAEKVTNETDDSDDDSTYHSALGV